MEKSLGRSSKRNHNDKEYLNVIKNNKELYVSFLQENTSPIMCSYKMVKVCFDVWGLRERVQQYVQRVRTFTTLVIISL